jgi:hypothetical protein
LEGGDDGTEECRRDEGWEGRIGERIGFRWKGVDGRERGNEWEEQGARERRESYIHYDRHLFDLHQACSETFSSRSCTPSFFERLQTEPFHYLQLFPSQAFSSRSPSSFVCKHQAFFFYLVNGILSDEPSRYLHIEVKSQYFYIIFFSTSFTTSSIISFQPAFCQQPSRRSFIPFPQTQANQLYCLHDINGIKASPSIRPPRLHDRDQA